MLGVEHDSWQHTTKYDVVSVESTTNTLSKDGVRPTEENSPDYNRPFLDVDMVSLVNATAIPPDLPHPPTPNPRRPTMTVTLRHPGGRPSQADCDGHNGLMMPSDGIIDSPWPRAPANTVVSLCIDV